MSLVLIAMIAVIVVLEFTPLEPFIANTVLLLYNPYRGLGTGFTGRLAGWEAALDAWAADPIFGRGIGLYVRVHNGFLQVVAEGGMVLTVMVLVFWFRGVRRALSSADYLKLAGVLTVSGYMAFRPRMFNLNLTSLIFWPALREWNVYPQSEKEDAVGISSGCVRLLRAPRKLPVS